MTTKLNIKITNDVQEFEKRVAAGESPEAVLKNMLRRIYKEQDRDTRHACAESVLQSNGPNDAHNICMNVNTLGA
jgi:hypothetical protein